MYDRLRPDPKKNVRVNRTLEVVLDEPGAAKDGKAGRLADSLMTGETIVRLAFAMEEDPDAGII